MTCAGRGNDDDRRSTVHGGANIGPDCVDLRQVEDAAPGRHLLLAIEGRGHETITIFGAQAPEIEGHASAGVAQLLAVARRAVVAINSRARPDLRGR